MKSHQKTLLFYTVGRLQICDLFTVKKIELTAVISGNPGNLIFDWLSDRSSSLTFIYKTEIVEGKNDELRIGFIKF